MSSSSSSILGKRKPTDALSEAPAPKEAKEAKEAKLPKDLPFSDYKWSHEMECDRPNWPVWDGLIHFQGIFVHLPSFLRCVFRSQSTDHAYKACNAALPVYQSMIDTLAACEDLLGNKKAKYAEQARVYMQAFRVSPEYAALRDAVDKVALKYVADRKKAAELKQAYETARAAYVTARDLLHQLRQDPVPLDVRQFLTEDELRVCVCQTRGHFDKCPCRHML